MPYEAANAPPVERPFVIRRLKVNCSVAVTESHCCRGEKLLVDAKVDGISTFRMPGSRRAVSGSSGLEAASRVFGSVIDNQADNYLAWNGLLKTLTQNFTQNDVTTIKIDGEKGWFCSA